MHDKKKHVIVGMSGGVDSTMAAVILRELGYCVTGVTMRIWGGEDIPLEPGRHACYGPDEGEEIKETQRIASQLGFDHIVIDLVDDYRRTILDYFEREYCAGRTPNPCVRCNARIKFGAMLDRIRQHGTTFDYFATGHYARIVRDPRQERFLIKRAVDEKKDQSYFLSSLTQEQIAISLFPLGEMTKTEVRSLAIARHLSVAEKNESQDFISCRDYSLLFDTSAPPGPILSTSGDVIGSHRGITHFTIGQRRGIGIAAPEPLYVLDIDAGRQAIIVGPKYLLFGRRLRVHNPNWIAIASLNTPRRVMTRIRQKHKGANSTIEPDGTGDIIVTFDEPQEAITPGQVAVFYDGDILIGGGVIARRLPE